MSKAKGPCMAVNGRCECDVCRFTENDIAAAPVAGSRTNKATADGFVGDPRPDEPTVYDDSHGEAQEVLPTAELAREMARQLREIVAHTSERLQTSEHKWGRAQITDVLIEVGQSANYFDEVAQIVENDIASDSPDSDDANKLLEELERKYARR